MDNTIRDKCLDTFNIILIRILPLHIITIIDYLIINVFIYFIQFSHRMNKLFNLYAIFLVYTHTHTHTIYI